MTVKVDIDIQGVSYTVRELARMLRLNKFEVNTDTVGYRVIMFRSEDERQWTQGYKGDKTRSGKNPRGFLRFSGPEEHIVQNVNIV